MSTSSVSTTKDTALSSLGPCWILSYDEASVWRSVVVKDWAAAMSYVNQISQLVEQQQQDPIYPNIHLSDRSNVRVVLPLDGDAATACLELAQAIDQIPVACSPTWLTNQTIDSSEQAVTFDTSHYQAGLNGDFLVADAIAKFGGDSQSVGIFEDPELRDIARAKEEIVKALRLHQGDVVADIGAGTGLLEPLLAESVGPTGKVLVSELSAVFRDRLRERCKGLDNIEILDDPTDRDPKLPQGVDLALMVDVYHHLEYPQAVLRRVRDSLKRHGALVVIDFHRDPARIHSHDANWVYQHLRADQATYTREIERTGFVKVQQVDVPGLPENFFLLFRKRPLPLSEPGAGWTC